MAVSEEGEGKGGRENKSLPWVNSICHKEREGGLWRGIGGTTQVREGEAPCQDAYHCSLCHGPYPVTAGARSSPWANG